MAETYISLTATSPSTKTLDHKNKGLNLHFISRIGNFLISSSKNSTLRVIAKKIVRDFWEAHSSCEQQLKSWFQEASNAEWKNPNQIKKEYPSASILNNNRIVFNIKGNSYRLIVKINYDCQMVWIQFVGTHAEYDKINANEI